MKNEGGSILLSLLFVECVNTLKKVQDTNNSGAMGPLLKSLVFSANNDFAIHVKFQVMLACSIQPNQIVFRLYISNTEVCSYDKCNT